MECLVVALEWVRAVKIVSMERRVVSNTEARPFLQRVAGFFRSEPPAPSFGTAYNETRQKHLATQLEVADHAYTRRKGLLGRDGLAPGAGLWIFPCESGHTFAMRFSIDLVYLDRKCVVKKVRSHVPPGRISACLTAHSVIELPAGAAAATGTEAGDRIVIERES